ncbi:hypothetical protein DFH28DRAFT_1127688 [Melampsora americana]|nr:hypothetical protein DFH28DRAFT_1127688 [Melampsora americana]
MDAVGLTPIQSGHDLRPCECRLRYPLCKTEVTCKKFKSFQSNLNGPNNHGLDGELIALDTNLDEMKGIIDRDYVMFQLRQNSSMSAGTTNNMSIPPRDALSGFNNTSSPPHPNPHQLQSKINFPMRRCG